MNNDSLKFRVFKAIMALPVPVCIINMFYFPLSEEPGLRKRFGKEYEEYCKNVPRYIPRLAPWKPQIKKNIMIWLITD